MPKIIDLTREIYTNMPVYPGDPEIKITKVTTLAKEGFTVHKLELNDQVGTHVETQFHMMKGRKLSDEPLHRFIGIAVVVDIPCREVKIADLEKYNNLIEESDTLILRSGYNERIKKIDVRDKNRPFLPLKTLEWIVSKGIKMIGIDCFDFDYGPNYPGHHYLFKHNILIVEGLVNLSSLHQRKVKFFAIPIKIQGVGGAPCRAFAIEDKEISITKSDSGPV